MKILQKKDYTKQQIHSGNIIVSISLIFGIIAISLLFYLTITPIYYNIFKYGLIFWTFGLGGAIAYTIFDFKYLTPKYPYLKYLYVKKRINTAGFLIFIFVIIPTSIFYLNNRPFSKNNKSITITSKVISKDKNTRSRRNYISSNFNYYININYNGKKKNVLIDKDEWSNIKENDFIKVHIITGNLGLDYIESITK